MVQCGPLLWPVRKLCSRTPVVSMWTSPQMKSHLCFLVLSGLAVSAQPGLEDVFFSPQNQTVQEGEAVSFQCVSGESSPPANITWLKGEEEVTRGRQIQGKYGGGQQRKTSGTLHLVNVTLEDDGTYVCETHNPSLNISYRSKPARLTVHGVPRRLQIIQGPDNITVTMGTQISMHCTVHGFPVPMVHWFKNGCHITNCSALFSLQNNGQLLTFRNVTKEDEGSYHCEASNQRETIKSRLAFLLPAEMDWVFVQQPVNLTVRSGENVTMTCRPPQSRPAAQVSWFKNNQLITLTSRVTALPSGDLFFHSVQEFDGGSYFCRASNVHLQRFLSSRRATLTVLVPPSVTLRPQLLTVPVGARVTLECRVSGQPMPTISWTKKGHSKQTGGKVASGLRNATLHIQSARSYDEGVYVCEASNPLGQSRSTAMLRVAVIPIIVSFAAQVSYRVGTSVVLPCRAVGILPITHTWTRGGAQTQAAITSSRDTHTDEHGALHISSVQFSDAGEYFCTAENRAGRHQTHTILIVTDEDHPADRDKQTNQVLSSSIITNRGLLLSTDSHLTEQPFKTTSHTYAQKAQHEKTACLSSVCDSETDTMTPASALSRGSLTEQMSLPSHGLLSPLNPIMPTTDPTRPVLPNPLQPQSVDRHTQPPLFLSHTEATGTDSGSLVVTRSHERIKTLGATPQTESQFQLAPLHKNPHQSVASKTTESVTDTPLSQPISDLPVSGSLSFLKWNSNLPTPDTFDTFYHKATSTLSPQTKLETQSPRLNLQPQSPSRPPISFLPKFHLVQSTDHPRLLSTQPQSSSIPTSQTSLIHSHPSATKQKPDISTVPQTQPLPQQTSTSTINTCDPSPMDPDILVVPKVNNSDQVQPNLTQGDPPQSTKSATNNSELTELLKRNTSQSPMISNDLRVTQQSPWLPLVEKHDIPIVVGVGVSLAFIFITVTFYSLVQKNEPAPTSRAAQRNLGVPLRHAERRTAGHMYENKAFEDDDCVAVLEQSPNTSDTRTRPLGPSLVSVHMEPTSEDLQEDSQENHSVTVETYPEPILDTKIDPFLVEEKGCSLSHSSIQLECAEDLTSNRGDNRSFCQDALPPPSPLLSRSPSPPSRREEALHSSLTLQTPEQHAAPIHHSLSISRGNPPLLLSHHVSLGLTTVAVDVHFYPASTSSTAAGPGSHVSTVSTSTAVTAPLLSPSVANSSESEQSTARFHHSK